eukprot:1528687-Rhodomonas_salina.3
MLYRDPYRITARWKYCHAVSDTPDGTAATRAAGTDATAYQIRGGGGYDHARGRGAYGMLLRVSCYANQYTYHAMHTRLGAYAYHATHTAVCAYACHPTHAPPPSLRVARYSACCSSIVVRDQYHFAPATPYAMPGTDIACAASLSAYATHGTDLAATPHRR